MICSFISASCTTLIVCAITVWYIFVNMTDSIFSNILIWISTIFTSVLCISIFCASCLIYFTIIIVFNLVNIFSSCCSAACTSISFYSCRYTSRCSCYFSCIPSMCMDCCIIIFCCCCFFFILCLAICTYIIFTIIL